MIMEINFTKYRYINSKSNDLLPCICENCGSEFNVLKKLVTQEITHNRGRIKFCSDKCLYEAQSKSKITSCANCGAEIKVKLSKIKQSKTGNNFCSKTCATSYNQKHKKFGYNRSKLELYIENNLKIIYPNLEIHFNRKDAIYSELDIYIPSLKIAFELNGITHYKPIYGNDKYNKTITNDKNKLISCKNNNIKLYVIDTSKQIYFKEHTSQIFLNLICEIINKSNK